MWSVKRFFFSPFPTLCFPLCISVTGACLIKGVGAHGWVVRFCQPSVRSPSWSWLPRVVAPERLGHQNVSSNVSRMSLQNVSGTRMSRAPECLGHPTLSVCDEIFYFFFQLPDWLLALFVLLGSLFAISFCTMFHC